MLSYRLFVPMTDEPGDILVFENLKKQIATFAGGYTQYTTEGAWQDEDGNVHIEHVYVLEFLARESDDHFLRTLCVYVKTGLRQQCVLYTVSHVEARFM